MGVPTTPTGCGQKWLVEANQSKYKIYSNVIKAFINPANSLHRCPDNAIRLITESNLFLCLFP